MRNFKRYILCGILLTQSKGDEADGACGKKRTVYRILIRKIIVKRKEDNSKTDLNEINIGIHKWRLLAPT